MAFLAAGFNHRQHPGHLVCVDVEDAVGVGGRTAPFGTTVEARQDNGAFAARRCEGNVGTKAGEAVEDMAMGPRGNVRDLVVGEELSGEGCGKAWDGLGGRGGFALEIGGGDGDLVDGEERLAGLTVEEEDVSGLGDLGDGIDASALVADGDEVRRGGQVAVPEVVVDHLVVPDAVAGAGVEGDEGICVEVVSDAVAAPEVEGGGTGGAEDEAALLVEGEAGPDVGAAGVLIGGGWPGFVAGFTGLGNGVEAPDQFTGAEVIGADGTRGGRGRAFAQAHPDDEEIAVDHAGGVRHEREPAGVAAEPIEEIDGTAFSEGGDATSGGGIDGMKEVAVAVDHASVRAVGPVDETAVDAGLRGVGIAHRIKPPEFASGGGVEGEQLEVGGRAEQDAVDDQRVALDLGAVVGIGAAGVIGPDALEFGDIARSQLAEGRVVAGGLVAEIRGPGDIGGGGRREGEDQGEESGGDACAEGAEGASDAI